MSEASLRTAMIRMATDEEFAARVAADPHSVAAELGLTEAELATLQSLRVTDDEGGPERMQGRISRSGLFTGGALSSLLDLGNIVGPDHAGIQCDGIVGPDHAGIQCNGITCNSAPKLPAGLLCDLIHPAGMQCNEHGGIIGPDHPAGLLCNGFHPTVDTHSLLCDGKPTDGLLCDGKPTDGLLCDGKPTGFICDGAHADVPLDDAKASPGFLCDGATPAGGDKLAPIQADLPVTKLAPNSLLKPGVDLDLGPSVG